MNKPASTTEKGPQPGPGPLDRRQLLLLSIVSGAILLFVAVAILVYLGLRGTRQPTPETPTPTERVEPTATTVASPVPVVDCETIISSGDVEVSVALPVSLTAKGSIYPVEPIVPQSDTWVYPSGQSGKAVWVCGTVVNYVIGLEPTAQNEELISSFTPGDDIMLRMSSGAVLHFRFVERRSVPPGGESALSQQKPRLTLVLPNRESWQVASADYAAEAESMATPPPEASARPGEAVQIGQARVTMRRGYLEQADDLPQGTAYYVTEFSIENVGEESLATDRVSVKLRDSMGNTYLVSPQASETGESGPLSGEIQPGASVQGSAGFVVPDTLPSGELMWVFSLRPDAGQVSIAIPFEGEGDADSGVPQPQVTINDAFLGDGGSILVIEGEIQNLGTQPLIVERADVTLSSSAGTGDLVTEAPPLPWTIQPGELQVIELQYQRPDASTVLLELLGYSFEIGGLQ